jgi:hypothetical protein
VIIGRNRSRLQDVPGYHPELADDREYCDQIYGWWGYPPYWAPGYAYPRYPYGI